MPAGTLALTATGPLPIDLFFEVLFRTGLWWKFLGAGQVLAGVLLMTQRLATLGALAFFPVSVNIFFITISMDFHGTPLITGLLVLANIGLLLWDYHRLRPLVLPDSSAASTGPVLSDQLNRPRYWQGLGTLLLLLSLLFGNRESPLFWFTASALTGLAGLVGYWILSRRQTLRSTKSH